MEEEANLLATKLTQMLQIVVHPEESKADEQCIYRVPRTLREVNSKAYTPQVVSIGPLHGFDMVNNALKPMEELKLKYLKGFLNRGTEMHVKDFGLKLKESENRIRTCYAEHIENDSVEFLTMILIDACFIIEHFLRYYEYRMSFEDWIDRKDPMLLNNRLRFDVRVDLILIENQLPFFVLEDIYKLAGMDHQFPSFLEVVFHYFEVYNKQNLNLERVPPQHFTDLLRTFFLPSSHDRRDNKCKNSERVCPQHFTDLLRTFFRRSSHGREISTENTEHYDNEHINSERVCPQHCTDLLRTFFPPSLHRMTKRMSTGTETEYIQHLYSVSQLSEAGLVFKVNTESECLFDLEFHNNELKMPCLTLYDETETQFRNIVAFEQCHYSNSCEFSQYLSVLDFLINTEKDVNILVDKKIIVNWIGDANAVVTMVNKLGLNVVLVSHSPKYVSLCKRLNKFYESPFNKHKAIFLRQYFNTPWKKASTIAAIALLLLTLIQTICSIISIFKG